MTGGIGDGQGVDCGFGGREFEATGVSGPDVAVGRIQSDGLGVRDVVAEIRGFATSNRGRSDVEGANGEFGTAELLDGAEVILAALLGLFFGIAAFQCAVGFIARKENVANVSGDRNQKDRGIEKGAFPKELLRDWQIGIHLLPPIRARTS